MKYNILVITSICACVFLMLFMQQCNKTRKIKKELERQEHIAHQNYSALTDSLEVYKNLIGETSFSKPIVEMNAEDIKKYFPQLYERLNAELGKVKIIWKTNTVYVNTGSVSNSVIELDNNKFSLNYDYYSNDSILRIKSKNTFYAETYKKNDSVYSIKTKPGISTIEKMELKLSFATGIKKEGDIHKIFVTPLDTGVSVTSLEGADVSSLLNPQPCPSDSKRWSIGFSVGYGAAFGKNNSHTLGPTVSFSLQYALIKF